jgi:hypothetical protein
MATENERPFNVESFLIYLTLEGPYYLSFIMYLIQHVLTNFIRIPYHIRKDKKDYIFTL